MKKYSQRLLLEQNAGNHRILLDRVMKMNSKSPSFPSKPYLYYSVVADTLHFFFPAMNYNYRKSNKENVSWS